MDTSRIAIFRVEFQAPTPNTLRPSPAGRGSAKASHCSLLPRWGWGARFSYLGKANGWVTGNGFAMKMAGYWFQLFQSCLIFKPIWISLGRSF